MKEFWDQRFAEPGFAYGQDPNEYFRTVLDGLNPGRLLLPGEGEGRNAIYAAIRGWEVTAVDQSETGRKKALAWAESRKLNIRFELADLSHYRCTDELFDLVAIIYVHLPPPLRSSIHKNLAACLNPGGMLIMECFHKEQLKYGTGGPPVQELLYSESELMEDFSSLDIQHCEKSLQHINQGNYHKGESCVVRLQAIKPKS